MKSIKNAIKLIISLIITAAFIPAFSAATITIIGGASGAEYSAYLLLNATDTGNDTYIYTINAKYSEIIYDVTGKSNDSDAISLISGLDTDEIRAFADNVYTKIKTNSLETDYNTANNRFEDVAPGYYLIAETKIGGGSDIISLVMLDTAGNKDVEIRTKEDIPSIIHKVSEINDSIGTNSVFQDAADHDIGDTIKFKATATLPKNIKSYGSSYIFNIYVELSDGLTLVCDESQMDEYGYPIDIDVRLDGSKISGNYKVTVDAGKKKFYIQTERLTDLNITSPESRITVEYSAVLNVGAVTGITGNSSSAYVEYSVSPYGEGIASSTKDKVTVFTYALKLDSVDSKGELLSGSGYTLYKYTSNSYVKIGDEQKSGTSFNFTGLDSGKYKLVQTMTPAGYNKAGELVFIIDAGIESESDDPKLLSLIIKDESGNVNDSFITSPESGIINAKIVSAKGIELPSTGGIGTVVFFIFGGLLMVGSIVMLAVIPINDRQEKKL